MIYRKCGGCGHEYATKRELRKLWFEVESIVELPWFSEWVRMTFTPTSKISYCPTCGDFFPGWDCKLPPKHDGRCLPIRTTDQKGHG